MPLRNKIVVMLSSLGEAHPRQLAHACGVDSSRLKRIMFGDGERYSIVLAPITLGLAELRMTPQGRLYIITDRGRKRARTLTARWRRHDAARRLWREEREGVQVHPHLQPAAAGGVGAPGGPAARCDTSSFRWCVEG